ncbi:MAG: hypothetical protein QNJ47_14340 [Nostocaceae cyanobacterium]|nr:hypothetical protein [Nostocaceae cyanobacterium]
MKFSVKSLYPISTSRCATNCGCSWELVAMGVEYLFMGNIRSDQGEMEEGNRDFRNTIFSFNLHNAGLKPDKRSGRYRLKNSVPI